jgi:ATP-dependent DNA helicase RecG
LLLHRPSRYEDRRHFKSIRELVKGESATTRGKIVAIGLKKWRQGTRSIFEIILDDGTARMHCRWWNLPFMQNYFKVGDDVLVFGRVIEAKPRTIDHPETEVIEAGDEISIHIDRVTPVYPLTEGLPQRWLRGLIWRALGEVAATIPEPHPELAAEISATLPTRADAVRRLHFPDELADAETARRRLALDEFIELQLAIQRRRKNLEANSTALACGGDNRLMKPFLAALGFAPTAAQARVLREIRRDLGGRVPMRRLLQGDVGSGKTLVAACASLMAIESGFDVALMAPTELLAEQHFARFREWFSRIGVAVELHTGTRKTAGEEGRAGESPALPDSRGDAARPALYVGTHALIERSFNPSKLGLVIIDEQHRFGVAQRERLVRKGRYPHLLVMTATPIPRTLGLTLYGDLDISVIDEMPPGRGRVRTFVRTPDRLAKVWEFVRTKIAEGRQAYVVYPRIGNDETAGELKAVTAEFAKLERVFHPQRVGLVHGRMPRDEQHRAMADFRTGKIRVLVATTVIEVGVDVANATVMVIENASRFGLSQLHQLRGRVGRGAEESECILIADGADGVANERLAALAKTTDGFKIAEEDLRLRGPGELLGREQSGAAKFRFGELATDSELIERARAMAAKLLAAGK